MAIAFGHQFFSESDRQVRVDDDCSHNRPIPGRLFAAASGNAHPAERGQANAKAHPTRPKEVEHYRVVRRLTACGRGGKPKRCACKCVAAG